MIILKTLTNGRLYREMLPIFQEHAHHKISDSAVLTLCYSQISGKDVENFYLRLNDIETMQRIFYNSWDDVFVVDDLCYIKVLRHR